MNRDRLAARLAEMGGAPDYPRLVREVLGISGATPALAERLVAQALVVEDRRETWRLIGRRIVAQAPLVPAVYVLRDEHGRALYVGKAINLRRRLRSHFADRRWPALKPAMARVAAAEWIEVGSELEALLREAALIDELQPAVNVQLEIGTAGATEPPGGPVHDVIVLQPSIEADSVELIAARADGPTFIQRTRRNGADLAVHTRRLTKFFRRLPARADKSPPSCEESPQSMLAPLVFSWLRHRGATATRLRPADARNARELRARLAALLADERLFHEPLDQRSTL